MYRNIIASFLLIAAAAPTYAATFYPCPEASIPGATSEGYDWDQKSAVKANRIALFLGHPSEHADQIPDNESKFPLPSQWSTPPSNDPHVPSDYWMVCHYKGIDTAVELGKHARCKVKQSGKVALGLECE